MDDSLLKNFRKHVFYHGTSLGAAESIAQHGFRVWCWDEEDGRLKFGGNLGIGVYVTSDWRVALWFGSTLLRVAIRPGSRLLNAAVLPNKTCIAYLEREFGREILNKPPLKVLPKNKQLTLRELVNLFRYHYCNAWEKTLRARLDDRSKWSRRRKFHSRLLDDFRKLLMRYGFDGYGNPEDLNGIVIFAEDRLELKEVVADFPSDSRAKAVAADVQQFPDIDAVKESFQREGSPLAKALAVRVAAAEADGGAADARRCADGTWKHVVNRSPLPGRPS